MAMQFVEVVAFWSEPCTCEGSVVESPASRENMGRGSDLTSQHITA